MSSVTKILKNNNHKSECGYLYVVSHMKYVYEVMISAKSLRQVDFDAHITLIYGETIEKLSKDEKVDLSLFDSVIYSPLSKEEIEFCKQGKPHFAYKGLRLYDLTPYEKTLFLDGDTYFCEPVKEIFQKLDYVDICMVMSPASYTFLNNIRFNEYDTGVIAFKKSQSNKTFFTHWVKLLKQKMDMEDQKTFIESFLFQKSIPKLYPLRFNYNFCTHFISLIGRGKVKILHGHHSEEEFIKIAKKINRKPAFYLKGYDIHINDIELYPRAWKPMYGKRMKLNHWLQYINFFFKRYFREYKFYSFVRKVGRKLVRWDRN